LIYEAAQAGLAPSEFWALSLRECELWRLGASAQRRWWRELAIVTAWQVAAFMRTAALPSLDVVLATLRGRTPATAAPPRQSARDHRRVLQTLAAQYGLPLTTRTSRRTTPDGRPQSTRPGPDAD
jgi:hypothetical protein